MILRRGTDGYEQRRTSVVWQSLVPERFPDAIAVPTTGAEVAEIVGEAAAAGAKVAVRSGGHNWLGACLRDEGVLIDARGLADVEVDVARMRAQVGPGATHKSLADAIAPHGLAFPIGHCPTVALGGYLLSGGMGWNLREWGPGCWNVLGAEVVTADGRVVRVDDDTHPDLLWALRGGGQGFPGVVTRFDLQLFPLSAVVARQITCEVSQLPVLLARAARWLAQAQPGLELSMIVRPAVPAHGRTARLIISMTAFAADERAAQARIAQAVDAIEIDETSVIHDSGFHPVDFTDLEGEGGWDEHFRYAADTAWVAEWYEEVGRIMEAAVGQAPSADSRVVLAFGFMPERDVDAAFTRFGQLTVNLYATWSEPSHDDANRQWLRTHMGLLDPFIVGRYVGEADTTLPGRIDECFPPAAWQRLQRVVDEHDPHGVFHGFLQDR